MSSAPPVPPFQLPRLTECLSSLPTAVTNPSMPGMHGTRDARANTSPARWGRREPVSAVECSPPLALPLWLRARTRTDSVPLLLPVDLTYVPTSVQKHESASCRKRRKKDWLRAILPDASPRRAGLSITSPCLAASALFTPDEARRSPS